MAWCHQAPSHYLSQCWPRSMSSPSPYDIRRPQRVNSCFTNPSKQQGHLFPSTIFIGDSLIFWACSSITRTNTSFSLNTSWPSPSNHWETRQNTNTGTCFNITNILPVIGRALSRHFCGGFRASMKKFQGIQANSRGSLHIFQLCPLPSDNISQCCLSKCRNSWKSNGAPLDFQEFLHLERQYLYWYGN